LGLEIGISGTKYFIPERGFIKGSWLVAGNDSDRQDCLGSRHSGQSSLSAMKMSVIHCGSIIIVFVHLHQSRSYNGIIIITISIPFQDAQTLIDQSVRRQIQFRHTTDQFATLDHGFNPSRVCGRDLVKVPSWSLTVQPGFIRVTRDIIIISRFVVEFFHNGKTGFRQERFVNFS